MINIVSASNCSGACLITIISGTVGCFVYTVGASAAFVMLPVVRPRLIDAPEFRSPCPHFLCFFRFAANQRVQPAAYRHPGAERRLPVPPRAGVQFPGVGVGQMGRR